MGVKTVIYQVIPLFTSVGMEKHFSRSIFDIQSFRKKNLLKSRLWKRSI